MRFTIATVALIAVAFTSLSAGATCPTNGATQTCADARGQKGAQACIEGSWSPCQTAEAWFANTCPTGVSNCTTATAATTSCAAATGSTTPLWCSYICSSSTNEHYGTACAADSIRSVAYLILGGPSAPVLVANLSTLQPHVQVQAGLTYRWTITGGTFTNTGASAGDNTLIAGYNTVTISAAPGTVNLTAVAVSEWGASSMPQSISITVVSSAQQPILTSSDLYADHGEWVFETISNYDATASYAWTVTGGTIISHSGATATFSPFTTATTIVMTCTSTKNGAQVSGSLSLPVYNASPYSPAPTIAFVAGAASVGGYFTANVPARPGLAYYWSTGAGSYLISSVIQGGISIATYNVTGAEGTRATVYLDEYDPDNDWGQYYWDNYSSGSVLISPWPRSQPTISLPSIATSGATVVATADAINGMNYVWSIDGGTVVGPASGQTDGGTNSVLLNIGAAPGSQFAVSLNEVNDAGVSGAPGWAYATASIPNVTVTLTSNSQTVTNVTAGDTNITASATALPGYTYVWTIDGGVITSSTTTAGVSTQATFTVSGAAGMHVILTVTGTYLTTHVQGSGSALIAAPPLPCPGIIMPTYITAQASGTASINGPRTGMTYQWTATAPGAAISGPSTGSAITFVAGSSGLATLSCMEFNAANAHNTSASQSSTIAARPTAPLVMVIDPAIGALLPSPYYLDATVRQVVLGPGLPTGMTATCSTTNAGVSFSPLYSNMVVLTVAAPIATANLPVGAAGQTLSFTCYNTNLAGTNGPQTVLTLTLVPPPSLPAITTTSPVTTGSTFNASVQVTQAGSNYPSSTYSWSIVGGTFTNPHSSAGETTGSVNTVSFTAPAGSVVLTVSEISAEGASGPSATATVEVDSTPPITPIVAPNQVTIKPTDPSGIYTATIAVTSGMTYTWDITGGAFAPGQTSAGSSDGVTNTILFVPTAVGTQAVEIICDIQNDALASTIVTKYVDGLEPPATPTGFAWDNTNYDISQGAPAVNISVHADPGVSYVWTIFSGTATLGPGNGGSNTAAISTNGQLGTNIVLECTAYNSANGSNVNSLIVPAFLIIAFPAQPVVTGPGQLWFGDMHVTVAANGITTETLEWGGSTGISVDGASGATLTFDETATAGNSVSLHCVATNAAGTPSPSGTLSIPVIAVPAAPPITAQPHVQPGATGLVASAPMTTGLTYAWQVNGDTALITSDGGGAGLTGSIGGVTSSSIVYNAPTSSTAGVVSITLTVGDSYSASAQSAFAEQIDPDVTLPAWPPGAQLTVSDVESSSFVVSWTSAQDNVSVSSYQVYANGILAATAGPSAVSVAVSGMLPEHTYALTIVARDAASNATNGPSGTVTTAAPTPGLAPLPTSLSGTAATSLFDSVSFLFSGPQPIQFGLADGTIVPAHTAILRGQVFDRSHTPLAMVRVSVRARDDAGNVIEPFGYTYTQPNGYFDLAINGGAPVIVEFEKDAFLPIQRTTSTGWQRYAWVGNETMSQEDPALFDSGSDGSSNVTFKAANGQYVRGRVVVDQQGRHRQPTLYFPPNVCAQVLGLGAGLGLLGSGTVHITEYTVEDTDVDAMPGTLPANSGYTHAVEFSMDEEAVLGGTGVSFFDASDPAGAAKPILYYVENFLDFPVGAVVPTGYYDRVLNAWIASSYFDVTASVTVPDDRGRVVQVLTSFTDGNVDLNVDGSDTKSSEEAIAALGIDASERAQLAALYPSGATIWRTSIWHFSAWDTNWGVYPPADAVAPSSAIGNIVAKCDCNTCNCDAADSDKSQHFDLGSPAKKAGIGLKGSADAENQVVRQQVPIAGTPFSLVYSSDRVPGRKAESSLIIPFFNVGANVQSIEVEAVVAGVHTLQTLPPTARSATVSLGLDAYGRAPHGAAPAQVSVGYDYASSYQATSRFGYNGNGQAITGNPARTVVTLWQEWRGTLGTWDATSEGLGGFTVNMHHVYDPAAGIMYLGDGTRQTGADVPGGLGTTIAGGSDPDQPSTGVSALLAPLVNPRGLAVAPDGSLYIQDWGTISKIGPDGIINAMIPYGVSAFAIGQDGRVVVVEQCQILRANSTFDQLQLLAGSNCPDMAEGGPEIFHNDGASALTAQIGPTSVAVGPDGTVYFVDTAYAQSESGARIRKIGTDGMLSTIAGGGAYNQAAPQEIATPATSVFLGSFGLFSSDVSIVVARDGKLYYAEAYECRLNRVDPNGTVTTVAGMGPGSFGLPNVDGPGLYVNVNLPTQLNERPDGSIAFLDFTIGTGYSRIRAYSPATGAVQTIAGGDSGLQLDHAASLISINGLTQSNVGMLSLAVAPDGTFYASENPVFNASTTALARTFKITVGFPGFNYVDGFIQLPSDSCFALFVMDF